MREKKTQGMPLRVPKAAGNYLLDNVPFYLLLFTCLKSLNVLLGIDWF